MAGEIEGARPPLPGSGKQSDGGTSWGGRMAALARQRPGEIAYRFLRDGREEPETLTWGELDRRTRLLAAVLRQAGAGERALLLCPPGLDYVTALFACLRGGIVAVPAYPPQRPRSLARVVALALDAEPLSVLTTAAVLKRLRSWEGELPLPAAARWIVVDRPLEGAGDPEDGAALDADLETAPAAPALLQYTSGSTGDPKGVVLTHANLLAGSARIHERFGMARHRHVVSWLPPYHDMGLVGGLLQPLYAGVPATLLSPAAFLQSPIRWLEALSGVEGVVSGAPDFAFDLAVRRIPEERRAGLDLSGWAVAFSGAEPVRAGTLERFARAFAPCGFRPDAFFPCYGLAEATLMVSGGDPGAGARVRSFAPAALEHGRAEPEAGGRPLVGCGRAIGGHEVAIVDAAAGRRRPEGEVGEIWVRGEGVGQGYWRRPGESESTFRARLAEGAEGGERWLRTGDLGFLDGGELFVTGRLKDLIVVRGRNLAPADLEHTAAGSHPALRLGGAAAFSFEAGGEERVVVVAELEPRAAAEGATDAVRRAVAEEHGVGLSEVVLVAAGAVPRTSSGKVRRAACRDLYREGLLKALAVDRVEEPASLLPPRFEEPAEEMPARLPEEREAWLVEYLCTLGGAAAGGRLDPELPPTAQGIDSLRSAELAARIEAGLGLPVGVDDVLAAPSVAALARTLAGRAGAEPAPPAPREAAPEREGALSAGQRALWSLARLAPESTAYHITAAARWLAPPPDAELLGALRRLTARHDALRTVFPARNGEPVRLVRGAGEAEADFAEVDAGGKSAAEVEALLAEEAGRPFDLENGPLLRVRFYRGPDVLLLAVHHLVADLASLQILAEELGRALGGRPLPPPPALTYGDYVRWQNEEPAGSRRPALAAFWERELAGVPQILELPLDRPRPPLQAWDGGEERGLLPAPLVARLAALARGRRATLFAVLLAGFEAFLARASRQERFLVGSPATGRTRPELAGLVGYLSNVLSLAADLTDDPPFAVLVDRARDRLLGALAHQDLPFPLLAEAVLERRDPARPPLVQVTVSYQEGTGAAGRGLAAWAAGVEGSRVSLGGLTFETVPVERRGAAFDLMLTLAPAGAGDGEGMAASLVFSSALFDRVTARRWLAAWTALLAGAAAEGGEDLPVSLLPWSLPSAARHLLAAEEAPHPAGREIHGGLDERFAAEAARRPEAVAVTAEDGEAVTYGELARRAGSLAARLRSLGVGPEVRVGLCLERSAALIEGILGVLAAGGAYLPLDPSYPEERLLFLLEDAAPRVVVTRRELAGRLGGFPRCLFLGEPAEEGGAEGESEAAGPAGLPLERAAYVIYTSGSTGRPKGVVVSHANAVRLFDAARPFFGFGEDDVWSLCHSASFDFSVWEIGGALLHGGRLVVVSEDDVRSPAALLDRVVREGVTVLSQTPSAFRQLARVEAAAARPEPWRLAWVTFGGEALDVPGLAPWFRRRGERQPRLVNLYGITETTVHVTCRPLSARDAAEGPKSPVGEPLPDLVVRLLGRRLKPVPAGLPGEMAVGGAGVARGYLGRPELTAARFVPDPWGPAGSRLYLSGDLARRSPSGELVFLGRADQQVKVRGFRIEPGEIEAVLGRHPAVGECVVVVRPAAAPAAAEAPAPPAAAGGVEVRNARLYLKGPSAVPAAAPGEALAEGETRLVAYVVARPGHEVSPAALRAFLSQRLPAPLVPAVVVPLARLPLTAHGKLDRRALPAPGGARPDLGIPYAPPTTATEEVLAEAWGEVLGVSRVGLDDDYFALGGDSILALRLAARAGERGVRFEVADLFRNPTVRELAAAVAASPADPDDDAGPLPWEPFPVPAGIEEVFPLSRMQAGLVFHSEQHPGSSVYRASFLYRFRGPFDPAALGRAADQLAARHGILRTSFDLTSYREPVQLVHREVSVPVAVRDLRGMPAGEQEEAVAAWFEEQRSRDFDWTRPPLLRLSLLWLEERLFDLGVTCHDAILDGWSTSLLLDELLARYSALLDGGALPVAAPPVSYRDFVALERRALASPADREFWRRHLAGVEPVPLPRRPGRRAGGAPQLRVVDVPLPDSLDAALEALAVRAGASLKHVALAAHVRVLAALCGTRDVVTGLEANGRPERPGAEQSVGQFLNTVPWRQRLVPGSWLDLVRETCEGERRMLPHRRFPYAEIQKGQGGRPLYESTFNYTHFHLFRGLERRSRLEVVAGRGRELTHYPLKTELNRHPWSGKLQLDVVFDGRQLTGAQARAVAALYLRTFELMAADPEARWETAPLLEEGERQQVLREWNDTAVCHPEATAALSGLCEAQAARTPDAVAAAFAGTFLSYAELLRRSARIARALLALGVTADRPVGVCCERSLELITALLGVLRAGGAFLPLDPSHPPARLALLLEELEGDGEAVVVAEERLRGVLAAAAAGRERAVRIVPAGAAAVGEEDGRPLPRLHGEQLAYVLHTSGSSGRPKGVMCTHRGIVNRLLWMQERFALTPGDRVLQKTPTTFDVSVWELFWPLAVGATLVLARPGAHLDPAELVRTVTGEGVTTLHFVPSLLGVFLAEPGAAACRSLRRVVASGEALPADLWRRFREVYGDAAPGLFNLYGPTEASVDVTAHRCVPEDAAGAGSVPIGRPVANTAVHVLDEALEPVPLGAPGELVLAGIQLARGYLGRPDLTADRFVPSPFAEAPGGERLYRTGDRTRRRPDGAVEFLGRVDGQVKLRGQRVEPGEIEALLAGHPGVLEAAVAVEGESPEHRRLVACLVGRPGTGQPGFEEIRGFLAAHLPRGLVPGRFVWLDDLPRTASGKVDRGSLAARVAAKEPRPDALSALLARVEQLSEEEVRALLAAPAGEPSARLAGAGGRR